MEINACDNCKFYMEFTAAILVFGYGSEKDGEEYCFCSDKCLKEFVKREVEKR